MLYTLSYAREKLGKYVAEGSCDPDTIDEAINNAISTLIEIADWKNTTRRIRLHTCKDIISLPEEFEMVRALAIDGVPSNVFNKYWEYMDGGPGSIDSSNYTSGNDLIDLGNNWPVMRDIDILDDEGNQTPRKIFAVSTEKADINLTLEVRGSTTYNNQILTSGVPGFDLSINRWKDGVEGSLKELNMMQMSPMVIKKIHSIVKPVTKGYITLYAVNPASDLSDENDPMLWWLAKYHPDCTNPGFRRFKMTNLNSGGNCVSAVCKLSFVPAKHDSDILLIQNLNALKFMMQANSKFDTYMPEEGNKLQMLAVAALDNQKHNSNPISRQGINVQCDAFGMGGIPRVQ